MLRVSLREFLEWRVDQLEKQFRNEGALVLAAQAARDIELERRLTALNDLRNEVLSDRSQFVTRDAFEVVANQLGTFLLREYYEDQHRSLADKVDLNIGAIAELRREISNVRSRNAAYAAALGAAFSIMTIVMVIIQFVRH